MRLPCGRSRGRVPAEVDTKTLSDVRNLLTTLVSVGLSKDNGSVHLIHMIKSQEQYNNIPYERLTNLSWISVRSRQMSLISSQTTNSIAGGFRKRENTGNHGIGGVKRKWWVFSSTSLFHARKREAVTQGETI